MLVTTAYETTHILTRLCVYRYIALSDKQRQQYVTHLLNVNQITVAQNDIRPIQQDLSSSRSGSVISRNRTSTRTETDERTIALPPRTPSRHVKSLEFDREIEL